MTFNLDNFLFQNKWRLDAKVLDFFYFPRECINPILEKASEPNPLLLKGPRGAGKTTILQIMIKHLVTKLSIPPENIFYFNLDDPLSCDFFRNSDDVINFIKGFVPKNDKQSYLIMDEIQHLITASSEPLALIQEIAAKFTGKLILTSSRLSFVPQVNGLVQAEIYPFSFKDYLNRMLNVQNIYLPARLDNRSGGPEWQENSVAYLTRVMTSDYSKLILPYLDDYLVYGGYPLVVREFTPLEAKSSIVIKNSVSSDQPPTTPLTGFNQDKKPELLRQVYEADFKELLAFGGKINQPERFTKLIQILAQENGELQKIMVQAKECGLSRATIEHYRDILVDNYFISAVYPNEDEAQSGVPIVYFNDTGLRNRLISLFHKPDARIDRDNLLNNFLYRNLAMLGGKITYQRFKRNERIIFNFKYNSQISLAMVLYNYPQRKSGRRGLDNLAQRIKPQKVIILTRDYFGYEKEGGADFVYIPATMTYLLPEILSIE